MKLVRRVGGSAAGLVGVLVTVLVFVMVVIGGNAYRKDCLTSQGGISQTWTFTWDTPIPFVFRPHQTGCVFHVGTRVALNAIGVDTFQPSTPENITGNLATSSGVDPYWPKLKLAVLALQNVPRSDTLAQHLAAITQFRVALAKLSPPPAYSAAHQDLAATVGALVLSGRQFRNALLRGDRRAAATSAKAGEVESSHLRSDLAALNRIHAAG